MFFVRWLIILDRSKYDLYTNSWLFLLQASRNSCSIVAVKTEQIKNIHCCIDENEPFNLLCSYYVWRNRWSPSNNKWRTLRRLRSKNKLAKDGNVLYSMLWCGIVDWVTDRLSWWRLFFLITFLISVIFDLRLLMYHLLY